MDVEKSEYRELTPTQEDFVEVENHCCLCGSVLAFAYEMDWIQQKVSEKAQCTTCGVQLKEKEHQVH